MYFIFYVYMTYLPVCDCSTLRKIFSLYQITVVVLRNNQNNIPCFQNITVRTQLRKQKLTMYRIGLQLTHPPCSKCVQPFMFCCFSTIKDMHKGTEFSHLEWMSLTDTYCIWSLHANLVLPNWCDVVKFYSFFCPLGLEEVYTMNSYSMNVKN